MTALEVLDYKVVASSSTVIKQDYNEYMWTMKRDFPEPDISVKPKAATAESETVSPEILSSLCIRIDITKALKGYTISVGAKKRKRKGIT